MKRMLTTTLLVVACSAGGFFVVDYLLNAYRLHLLPKNFSVVKPGVLYRSGQMRQAHFRQVLEQHGIKTVVVTNPREVEYEATITRQMGVKMVEFKMPGSGQGDKELFHEYLRILGDPANRPVLVHCNAGAYRTGASVALYRMVFEGWTLEDAVDEMRYSGYSGQQDIVDHIQATYESIPPDIINKVVLTEEADRERRY